MTVDSVFLFLKKSAELQLEDIKKLATSFAHQNWPQFCGHKGGMEIIGIELFQEITIAMQFFKEEEKIDTRVEALKVVPCTVIEDYKEILREARFADADFVFPNPDVAENIKFHRCIVAAHTKPLSQLIMASNKSKQYILDGVSYVATKDLLEYIYFGDTNFNPVGACRLIENAVQQYALQHILDPCIDSISNGITDEYSVDILRVTYLPNFQTQPMKDLRGKVLDHICKNFRNVSIPTIRSVQPADIAYQMVADVLDSIYHNFNDVGKNSNSAKSCAGVKQKKKPRAKVARTLSSSEKAAKNK